MRLIIGFIYKNLVLIIIGLSVFFIFFKFSYFKLNTADASLYLSTAENIANHKGFVVSDNLYQYFNTLYHPLLPYYVPLYSFFASFFINHGGIVKVIQVNILLFALNAALVFYIIQEVMPTYFNVFFIFFLVFSPNFFISALYAWTEQFYFFCFIVSFILFLRFRDRQVHLLWLGALNGIFMLIRVAHLYNFLAYLPILFIGKDSLRQKLNRAFCFVGGFVLAYGFYQLFCLIKYHIFYPECPWPAVSYVLARITSGIIYDPHKVGIQLFLGPFFSFKNFLGVLQRFDDFYHQMPFFLWPALFYYFIPTKKGMDGGLIELFFLQSVFTVLGYSFTFYWLPSHLFDSLRYSLIPFVLISVAGWYCLYQGLFSESLGKKLIGGLILLSLLCPQLDKFVAFKSNLMWYPLWERPYYKDLHESYEWIDKNLSKEILVASDEDQQNYFMHRPFISLPPRNSFNCTNLSLYNRIYSPDYYLLSSNLPDKCFLAIPHTKIFSNKTFRLYKVEK